MRKTFAVFFLLLFLLAVSSDISPGVNDYPFSDIINWGTDSRQRKDYEKYLKKGGVEFLPIDIEHQDEKMKLAESEKFILVKKGGAVIGYGIIFTDFKFSGYAVNKKKNDTREIALKKAEIFYDTQGRHIFMVSYRTKGLSGFEIWMAKRLGHRPEAFRRDIDINNLDLGEGYEFDEKSQGLARFLLNFPKECKGVFDKNGVVDGKLAVPIDENVFNSLGG